MLLLLLLPARWLTLGDAFITSAALEVLHESGCGLACPHFPAFAAIRITHTSEDVASRLSLSMVHTGHVCGTYTTSYLALCALALVLPDCFARVLRTAAVRQHQGPQDSLNIV